jgi:hypothetical protein
MLMVACGGGRSITAPQPTQGYLGFDIGLFPGTAALQAWKYPASPYRWIGYYLPAPCHRDSSFVGKLPTITAGGWGTAALYVGQQDWANIGASRAPKPTAEVTPPVVPPRDTIASAAAAPQPVCSASLLTTAHGTSEAADAVAKMRNEGFADGSIVFLDVEGVASIGQPLLDYYRAWMTGVLNDGHYKPGAYLSKANAPTFHELAITSAAGAPYSPPLWIAAQGDLTMTSRPTDVGLPYAQIWQAMFEVTQQFNGASLQVDANVAAKPSPSSP